MLKNDDNVQPTAAAVITKFQCSNQSVNYSHIFTLEIYDNQIYSNNLLMDQLIMVVRWRDQKKVVAFSSFFFKYQPPWYDKKKIPGHLKK